MTTLNARVGAVAMAVGACGTVVLKLAAIELVPMMLLALGITAFGVWAFADEMGVRKPLNRAGLVAFGFSAGAKTLALLEAGGPGQTKFYILHAYTLLVALLFWSAAFLHRDREMKIAGVLVAVGTILPIFFLIAGHIFLAVGAFWGIGALYDLSVPGSKSDLTIITVIDAVFLAWCLLAAAMLWRGKVQADPH